MTRQIRAFLLMSYFAAVFLNVNAFGSVKINDYKEGKIKVVAFRTFLKIALSRRALRSAEFCDETDAVSRRVLKDYGAIFLAGESVITPPVCIFANEQAVTHFQRQIPTVRAEIEGVKIELQSEAMNALLAARSEAIAAGLNITPRDGAEAARRDYADTMRLWNSRFLPALGYWQQMGKLTDSDAKQLLLLPVHKQISMVLELEERGIFFSKDFSKSILYSVAAPGSSQHLSLLAFDANEFSNEKTRQILARHGWFRTVKNDLPHFTFLGIEEKELPLRGLRKLTTPSGEFWIPNM